MESRTDAEAIRPAVRFYTILQIVQHMPHATRVGSHTETHSLNSGKRSPMLACAYWLKQRQIMRSTTRRCLAVALGNMIQTQHRGSADCYNGLVGGEVGLSLGLAEVMVRALIGFLTSRLTSVLQHLYLTSPNIETDLTHIAFRSIPRGYGAPGL